MKSIIQKRKTKKNKSLFNDPEFQIHQQILTESFEKVKLDFDARSEREQVLCDQVVSGLAIYQRIMNDYLNNEIKTIRSHCSDEKEKTFLDMTWYANQLNGCGGFGRFVYLVNAQRSAQEDFIENPVSDFFDGCLNAFLKDHAENLKQWKASYVFDVEGVGCWRIDPINGNLEKGDDKNADVRIVFDEKCFLTMLKSRSAGVDFFRDGRLSVFGKASLAGRLQFLFMPKKKAANLNLVESDKQPFGKENKIAAI
jgi:hypothetical protein